MSDPKVDIDGEVGPIEAVIDADHAAAYALATNDPNPAYQDGGVVPPVFSVSLILQLYFQASQAGVPAGAVRNVRGGVHGSHDLYLHRPLVAGMAVRAVAGTQGASNTPAGARTTQHIVLSDLDGNPCVEHLWTTIHIGGEVDPVGPELPDHSFPSEARDRPLGSHTVHTDRDQTFRYAGSSTDHAPMHVHDEFARRVGFPRKFLQGLCTFAICGQGVIEVAAGGDPLRLRRLAARFASPVFPGDDVTIDVYDAGDGPESTRRIAFEASSSSGASVIKHGLALLSHG